MIDGVVVTRLTVHADDRGWLQVLYRRDDPEFKGFGQVYVTCAYPGVVKGWHLHRRQTDTFHVVHGMAKIVMFDDRPGSPSRGRVQEVYAGEQAPVRVQIPPGVLHGFTCVGPEPALVVNVPDVPYDAASPDEERVPPHGVVPYEWARRDG